MAMTPAERQARYRELVKDRAAETPEAAIERVRQVIYSEVIEDTRADASFRDAEDVERDVTFLAALAAKPMWPPGEFQDWLMGTVVRAVEDQISQARKAARVGSRKRRAVT